MIDHFTYRSQDRAAMKCKISKVLLASLVCLLSLTASANVCQSHLPIVNAFKSPPRTRSMATGVATSLRAGSIPDPQPELLLPDIVPPMKAKLMPVSHTS
jgi:hypothetical protein